MTTFDLTRIKSDLENALEELIRHYEMPDSPEWLCKEMLKRGGVDVEAWHKERSETK